MSELRAVLGTLGTELKLSLVPAWPRTAQGSEERRASGLCHLQVQGSHVPESPDTAPQILTVSQPVGAQGKPANRETNRNFLTRQEAQRPLNKLEVTQLPG